VKQVYAKFFSFRSINIRKQQQLIGDKIQGEPNAIFDR